MAVKHGTRYRYLKGCRCEACAEAERVYQRDYRLRTPAQAVTTSLPVPDGRAEPGPVERGVEAEISGPGARTRPGLAQAALALARVMDSPRAVNQHAAAAKVLATLLEKLHAASARGRRGGLAVVRAMNGQRSERSVLEEE
jgi:hypothetical protein